MTQKCQIFIVLLFQLCCYIIIAQNNNNNNISIALFNYVGLADTNIVVQTDNGVGDTGVVSIDILIGNTTQLNVTSCLANVSNNIPIVSSSTGGMTNVSSSGLQQSSSIESSSVLLSSSGVPTVTSSSSSLSCSGIQASNNVASSYGISVWNVNKIGCLVVGMKVQITWTDDSNDYMRGCVITINSGALTVTVNVDTVSGSLGIPWTPWDFSVLLSSGCSIVSSSSRGSSSLSSSLMSSSLFSSSVMGLSSSSISCDPNILWQLLISSSNSYIDGGCNGNIFTTSGTSISMVSDPQNLFSSVIQSTGFNNDYIHVTSSLGAEVPAIAYSSLSSFSFSVWIYPYTYVSDTSESGLLGTSYPTYAFPAIYITTNNIVVLAGGCAIYVTSTKSSVQPFAWNYVVVTSDNVNNNYTIFINGVNVGSNIGPAPSCSVAGSIIGNIAKGGNVASFDGLISQPTIYNVILTPSMISQQYYKIVPQANNIKVQGLNQISTQTGLYLNSSFSLSQVTPFSTLNSNYSLNYTIFVDPISGSDNNVGNDTSHAFKTLFHTQLVVRRLIQLVPTSTILINLLPGIFFQTQSLFLTQLDSPISPGFVLWKATSPLCTQISGGVILPTSSWSQFSGNMYQFTLPSNMTTFRTLYVNNTRLTRAITNNWPLNMSVTSPSLPFVNCLSCNLSTISTNLSVEIVLLQQWFSIRCPGIWFPNQTIEFTSVPCWNRMISGMAGTFGECFANPTYPCLGNTYAITWLENALPFLTQPGTFVIVSNILYCIFPAGMTLANGNLVIVAPQLSTMIYVSSGSNIFFNGIEFSHSNFHPLYYNDYGINMIQDNYLQLQEGYSTLIDTMISLYNSNNVLISYCLFNHIGTTGVGINGISSNTMIWNNTFTDLSGTSIRAGNIPFPIVTVNNTYMEDNLVYNVGIEFYGTCGLSTYMTNYAIINHNTIHDVPYSGVNVGIFPNPDNYLYGNQITNNLVYRNMLWMSDGGSLYLFGPQPGGIVQGNYFHDVSNDPNLAKFPHFPAPTVGYYFESYSNFFTLYNDSVLQNIAALFPVFVGYTEANFNPTPYGEYFNGPFHTNITFINSSLSLTASYVIANAGARCLVSPYCNYPSPLPIVSSSSSTSSSISSSVGSSSISSSVGSSSISSSFSSSLSSSSLPYSPSWTISSTVPRPLAWLPLQYDLNDYSGNNNNAATTGTTTGWGFAIDPIRGSAWNQSTVNFGGLILPTVSYPREFSLCAFFIMYNFPFENPAILNFLFGSVAPDPGSFAYFVAPFYNNFDQYFYFTSTPVQTFQGIFAAYSIDSPIWYHTCLTLDLSGNANLYLNGLLTASFANPDNIQWQLLNQSANVVQIGAHWYSGAMLQFEGLLQHTMVFNKSLTASQVATVLSFANNNTIGANSSIPIIFYVQFGGFLSVGGFYNNSITGTFGCAPNYILSGTYGTVNVSYNSFMCYKFGAVAQNQLPAYTFGGIFGQNVSNPSTGNQSCASGFTQSQFYGFLPPAALNYNMSYCYREYQAGDKPNNFAGTYSLGYNNVLTSAQSCPMGYNTYQGFNNQTVYEPPMFYYCYNP